jgi:AcrR family transcriptional regulator
MSMSGKVTARNSAILEAAVALAGERGFRSFSREDVAARAAVAVGTVNNAYGTMAGLHDAVMQAALDRQLHPIVAAGIVERHPLALAAPQDVKDSALAALA